MGGVETLFKDSSDTVMEYAANAYKTAGLSANAYMETVTSFSASLLQGLGGDTLEAAQIADLAITDMADNANKMGTDITAIQNAYQGFAKQNYTMLDNLKLGYGGTQSEMIRLINDSGILEEEISSLDDITFDQMIAAIHAVQTDLGITGTTALEASTTIEGSLNSAKAAWSNLITGIADDTQDFDLLVDNFVDSVVTAGNNLIPRIETVITGIGKLIEELLPVIVSEIPVIVNDILPELIQSGIDMIGAIVSGIEQNLPQIAEGAGKIVNAILEGIGEVCPALSPVTNALQLLIDNFDNVLAVVVPLMAAFVAFKATLAITETIKSVKTAFMALNAVMAANPVGIVIAVIAALVAAFIYLWNNCEEFREFWIGLWDTISTFFVDIWNDIVTFFTETIPEFIENIGTWFSELPEKIWEWLIAVVISFIEWGESLKETACEKVNEIIDSIVAFFTDLPYKIGYAIGNVIGTLAQWALNVVDWITTEVPEIIENIVVFFSELPEKIWEWLVGVVAKVLEWRQNMIDRAKEIGQGFLDSVISFIKELPTKIWEWFKSVVTKVLEFRQNMVDKAKEVASGFVTKIVDGVKSLPEKIKEIGKNIVSGLWNGIKNAWSTLVDNVSSLATGLIDGVKDVFGIHSPSKEFAWIGKMCVAGFDESFDEFNPYDELNSSMQANIGTLKASYAGAYSGGRFGNVALDFDYDRMGQEIGSAIDGMAVNIDSKPAGKILAPAVNDALGAINRRRT